MRSRLAAATAGAPASRALAARSRWRPATLAVLLLVLTNGPVFLFAKSVLDRPGHWEDWAVWPFFAGTAAAAAVLAFADGRGRPRRPVGTVEWTAAAAIAWYSLAALASSMWSVDRSATVWRAAVYLGLALLAWLVSALDSDDLRLLLTLASGSATVASVALVALRPDLGLDPNGHWQGVYTNRNSLAPVAAVAVLTGLCLLFGADRRARRIAGAGLAVAAVGAMAGAGSRTAWLALGVAASAAAAPIALTQARLRWGAGRARAVSAAAAVAAVVGGFAAAAALWDVGTFSQRRAIWGLVWDRIVERPFGGHGFFTFWDIEELTMHVLLRRGSAHNSLVEVGLGLGLLGTLPFMVIVVMAARNAWLRAWRSPGADTWMWAAVVALLLVENVTESFVLWFSYNWVLLAAAALRFPMPAESRASPDQRPDTAVTAAGEASAPCPIADEALPGSV